LRVDRGGKGLDPTGGAVLAKSPGARWTAMRKEKNGKKKEWGGGVETGTLNGGVKGPGPGCENVFNFKRRDTKRRGLNWGKGCFYHEIRKRVRRENHQSRSGNKVKEGGKQAPKDISHHRRSSKTKPHPLTQPTTNKLHATPNNHPNAHFSYPKPKPHQNPTPKSRLFLQVPLDSKGKRTGGGVGN